MAQYTFNPTSLNQFVDWSSPSIWLGGLVPNSADADVVFPQITSNGSPYQFDIDIATGESFLTRSISLTGNVLTVDGSLAISQTLAAQSSGIIMHGGSLVAGSLNGTFYLQGFGAVQSSGVLTNNFNIVGNGLSLTLGGLVNNGFMAAASGNLTVSVAPGQFTNLNGSTLTGGNYQAGYSGNSTANPNIIYFDVGQTVATLAASIDIERGGAIKFLDPVTHTYVSFESTLQTITTGGSLTIGNNTNLNFGALNVDGSLVLGGGSLHASNLTIDPSAHVNGSGTITAPLVNNGKIVAAYITDVTSPASQSIIVNGDIAGSGSFEIDAALYNVGKHTNIVSGVIEINGATSEKVVFAQGAGTLQLDQPSTFTGLISAASVLPQKGTFNTVQATFNLLLEGVSLSSVTNYSYAGDSAGGVLTIQTTGNVYNYHFAGAYTKDNFALSAGPQILSTVPPSLSVTVTPVAAANHTPTGSVTINSPSNAGTVDASFHFTPGLGFSINGHTYVATPTTYSITDNLSNQITATYGATAHLASWQDLKADLTSASLTSSFLGAVGLPVETPFGTYPNLFVSNNGAEFSSATQHFFITNFSGSSPDAVGYGATDSINSSAYLGAWYWAGQALVELPSNVVGQAIQGQVLSASNTLADADGLGAITYQWNADGAAIAGATGSTFTIGQAQVGHVITVVASYTDGFGAPENVSSSGVLGIAAGPTATGLHLFDDGSGQNLVGGSGNDDLHGDAGLDHLIGGPGADVLDGGGGFNFAQYTNATAGVAASLSNPSSNTGDAAGDVYISIQGLVGSSFDDTLQLADAGGSIWAGAGNDTLMAESGNSDLHGEAGNDHLIGGAGNDTLDGGSGNDSIDGAGGFNTALYSGVSKGYTIVVGSSSMSVQDKVAMDGTDMLTNVQSLQFADQALDTTWFTKTMTLSASQIVDLTELYIASFNRAPDALGLDYWGSRLHDGMTLDQIAKSFFVQPETIAAYPSTQSTSDFITQVYNNVLGRGPDTPGLNYWLGELANGDVSKDSFLLAIINGARAASGSPADATYLANKELVGAHFALTDGLSDIAWARAVMANVDATSASVATANAMSDADLATANTTAGTELVVQLVGLAA